MKPFHFDDGSHREPKTRTRTSGAVRRADEIDTYPGDTIGTITERAYGANTPALRHRILQANNNLEGSVHVPR